jgi:folate-binding protein YgfZ
MSEQHPPDFTDEYRSACERAALFDLSDRGKVAVSGRDAFGFLHNLCTNDIKKLPPGGGCEAFLTTAKARVVAHFFVSRWDGQNDGLLLDIVPGMAEKLLQQLDHYLISEQVELSDQTGMFALLHLCGPHARQVLADVLALSVPDLAELQGQSMPLQGETAGFLRRHDWLNLPGYDIIVNAANASGIREALLKGGAAAAGQQTFETLRVEAGFPLFGPDMDENRLVMEVGRTQQAICYTKGCYLGQEPIVMARDRGHVNRTLLGLRLADGNPVPPGVKVVHDGKEVGLVTSSVYSPRLGTAIALAYLQRGSQSPGTAVTVETPNGPQPAEVAALPFDK